MRLYWLSFVDPETRRNLGMALVEADTFLEAVKFAHRNGCNPGGEVKGALVPLHLEGKLSAVPRTTLLCRHQIEALGVKTQRWRA